jgi:hypothetical protein
VPLSSWLRPDRKRADRASVLREQHPRQQGERLLSLCCWLLQPHRQARQIGALSCLSAGNHVCARVGHLRRSSGQILGRNQGRTLPCGLLLRRRAAHDRRRRPWQDQMPIKYEHGCRWLLCSVAMLGARGLLPGRIRCLDLPGAVLLRRGAVRELKSSEPDALPDRYHHS